MNLDEALPAARQQLAELMERHFAVTANSSAGLGLQEPCERFLKECLLAGTWECLSYLMDPAMPCAQLALSFIHAIQSAVLAPVSPILAASCSSWLVRFTHTVPTFRSVD